MRLIVADMKPQPKCKPVPRPSVVSVVPKRPATALSRPPMPLARPGSASRGTAFTPDSTYRDDQPFEPKSVLTPSSVPTEDRLELKVRAAFSHFQPLQEVPCMVSLTGVCKDLEEIERSRPGLDLVCVIDISGSMRGSKVELTRQTMRFLVSKLTKHDRLSLVVFNDFAFRGCPLLCCNETYRPALETLTSQLRAEGGTNMIAGLECGLRVLAGRRTLNTVTSLFFLSDGVDNNRDTALTRSQALLTRYRTLIPGDFSLHSFGYGSDHDSNIMCNLADQGCGAFHYVEHFESIAEAFADSFGGLVSLVARNIQVRLEVLPSPVPCRVTKLYTKSEGQVYMLPAIMANENKDLVFLLEVADLAPASFPALRAVVTYQTVTSAQVTETVELEIQTLPKGAEITVNEEVLVNFSRVKGAEVLREASQLAEQGQFLQAHACLLRGIEELRNSPVASNELTAAILRDLQDAIERTRNEAAWRAGGAAQVKSTCTNHYAQVASSNTAMYAKPQQAAYSKQFKARP